MAKPISIKTNTASKLTDNKTFTGLLTNNIQCPAGTDAPPAFFSRRYQRRMFVRNKNINEIYDDQRDSKVAAGSRIKMIKSRKSCSSHQYQQPGYKKKCLVHRFF